jgi:Brp/Blh family beta-carotene 15,15'-monooxygenase
MNTRLMPPGFALSEAGSARSVLLGPRLVVYAAIGLSCVAASTMAPRSAWTHGAKAGGLVLTAALAAIAIAMWHGAYDAVQAEPLLKPRFKAKWRVVFPAGYAALVAATLLGWWAFPFVSLLLFLAYSAWHFGTEPERGRASTATLLAGLALGALPIVAACRWHGAEVQTIFAQMLRGMPSARLTSALATGFWPVLALTCAGALTGQFGRSVAERWETLSAIAVTTLLFVFCNPLIAFAVYFCCWHTPEHLISTSLPDGSGATMLERLRSNLRTGLLPWLLSLVLLGIVFMTGQHAAASYRAEIFIVLSALTVPHMALNELGRWQAARRLMATGALPGGKLQWRRKEA